jgi:hypothetical protein
MRCQRKKEKKNLIPVFIFWLQSRLMGCLVFLAALSLSFGAAHAAERILSRHSKLNCIILYT